MKDITITINRAEKTLSFNNNSLQLNKDSFKGVKIPKPEEVIHGGCKPGETCLHILYRNNKDLHDEANNLISHMKENKLGEFLRITQYQNTEDLVQIVGEYQLKIN